MPNRTVIRPAPDYFDDAAHAAMYRWADRPFFWFVVSSTSPNWGYNCCISFGEDRPNIEDLKISFGGWTNCERKCLHVFENVVYRDILYSLVERRLGSGLNHPQGLRQ